MLADNLKGSPDNPRASPDNPRGSPYNPKGSPEKPRVRRTTPRSLLCGPYKSLHAHMSLNSAVLIGVASMKPRAGPGLQSPSSKNPIKTARGRLWRSPDNPRGYSRTTPRVRRTTAGVHRTTPGVRRSTPRVLRTIAGLAGQPRTLLLCGPYKSLHAHVSLNSAVLIGVASMKPLSGRVCRFAQA